MSKCPKCGAIIEAGSRFCGECGESIPQSKECPRCHAQVKQESKFCSECGYDFIEKANSKNAFSMGDKNVIAGDVIGHQESYSISGNATIVKNEDETKKMVRCHICGKNLPIAGVFTCSLCGENACEECYDKKAKACVRCTQKLNQKKEAEYKELLAKAYADGKLDVEERNNLDVLRNRLQLTKERAYELEEAFRLKVKSSEATLSRTEEATLESVEAALYGALDADKALKDSEGVYLRHKDNERALSIYLTALIMVDRKRAEEMINALPVDFESAYVASFDLAMMTGDYLKAEQVMRNAAELWPESEAFILRRIEFNCSLFYEHNDKTALDEAEQGVIGLESTDDKIVNSWCYYLMRLVSMFRGDDVPDPNAEGSDDNYNEELMFDALAHGRICGFMSVDLCNNILDRVRNDRNFLELDKTPVSHAEYCTMRYLVAQKNPIAMLVMGDCLLATTETEAWFGLKKNPKEAFANYKKAASIVDANIIAQDEDGEGEYVYYIGDNEDVNQMVSSVAHLRLAFCYKYGIGCEKSMLSAIRELRDSISKGWNNVVWDLFYSELRQATVVKKEALDDILFNSNRENYFRIKDESLVDILKLPFKI